MLFFSYAYRSLLARMRVNAITILSVCLFVTGGSLGLAYYTALQRQVVDTAASDQVIVLAEGTDTEVDSEIERDAVQNLAVIPGIKSADGGPLLARELLSGVLLVPSVPGHYQTDVTLRGIDATSATVHRARIVQGTMPARNTLDLVFGRRIAAKYPHLTVGSSVSLPGGPCTIVGVFAADGGPHEDEVWTWREALEIHTKAEAVSSVTIVAESAQQVPTIVGAINNRKDLAVRATSLAAYRERDAGLRTIAKVVFIMLLLLAAVGTAAIAATMTAAVAVRVPEFAAMAAIGIRKSSLAKIVVLESALLGTLGGLIGVVFARLLGSSIGASILGDSAVTLSPSVGVMAVSLGLGVLVGVVAAIVPAVRVRRLDILRAMR